MTLKGQRSVKSIRIYITVPYNEMIKYCVHEVAFIYIWTQTQNVRLHRKSCMAYVHVRLSNIERIIILGTGVLNNTIEERRAEGRTPM
jgi:hypothetical protein